VIEGQVIIGEDDLGYYEDENHKKTMIPHHGGVHIGNDVFIGPQTDIARGTLSDTKIGNGVKMSGACHIGHNNILEDDITVICSQTYGSVHIKRNAYIVGSVIKNQCTIGKDAFVSMGSLVISDVEDNAYVVGMPARAIRRRYKTDK
jgi:UDP-3-O-[3-hydroxymyristoyl] glucosamine N-acyltransferase